MSKPTISLTNVHFNIGNKQILHDISMNISRPGLIVITGSVGSGKSSLLKVILRDYQPINRGKAIFFDDHIKYSCCQDYTTVVSVFFYLALRGTNFEKLGERLFFQQNIAKFL